MTKSGHKLMAVAIFKYKSLHYHHHHHNRRTNGVPACQNVPCTVYIWSHCFIWLHASI